jgi:hypothetical protein
VSSNHGKVPVRIANFSDKAMTIPTNRTIGCFYTVDEIGVVAEGIEQYHRAEPKEYKPPQRTKRSRRPRKPQKEGRKEQKTTIPAQSEVPVWRPTSARIAAVSHPQDQAVESPNTNKPVASDEITQARLSSLLEKLEIKDLCLTEEQKSVVIDLLAKHQFVFSMGDLDLGSTTVSQHTIDTKDAEPIKQRPRHVPPHQQHFVDDTVKELLNRGLIQESRSPCSSPIVLAKKSNGPYRLCVDYRKLNACTVKSAQPLARIDDTLNRLSGSQFFTSLDCASGY